MSHLLSAGAIHNIKQSSTRILDPRNSRESQLHFFSLNHEKWFFKVSISSRNMRITICNLVLISKYENGHVIISISSRQARARKIILSLVSKNLAFSREWEWNSKSKKMRIDEERIFGIIKLKPQAFSLAAMEMILGDIFVKVTSMMEHPDCYMLTSGYV